MEVLFIDRKVEFTNDGDNMIIFASSDVEDVVNVSEGHYVVVCTDRIIFVNETMVRQFPNVVGFYTTPEALFVVSAEHGSYSGTLFNFTFDSLATIYCLEDECWIFPLSKFQMIFPFNVFKVTGYKNERIYGYRNGVISAFNLVTRTYVKPKKLVKNLQPVFKSIIRQESDDIED